MLSRTAENLFWMARDMERAENTARMLDVSFRMSLLPSTLDKQVLHFEPILDIEILHLQPGLVEALPGLA